MTDSPVTLSEPPKGGKPADQRPVTLADVLMKLAHDGPAYAVFVLVGLALMSGKATTSESVIAMLASLLARSYPRPVRVGGAALVFVVFCWRMLNPQPLPPHAYAGELRNPSTAVVLK